MAVMMSDEALELLTDEPGNLLKLYAWLCVHVDRKTGIVGKCRRISEQYAKERMSVAAVQGRKATIPTRSEIRNAFHRLITLGLLVEVGSFVFSMPKEIAPFSVQNNNDQATTKQQPTQVHDFNSKIGKPETDVLGNNDPPLQSINQQENDVFCMSDHFQLSTQFPARAGMAGFEIAGRDKALLQVSLADVVMYWQSERPNERRNQVKWERTVLQTMVRLRQQGVSNRAFSSSKPAKPHNQPSSGLAPIPRDNDALEGWAKQHGAPAPTIETYDQYRRVLTIWRDTEMARRAKGVQYG